MSLLDDLALQRRQLLTQLADSKLGGAFRHGCKGHDDVDKRGMQKALPI